MKKIFLECKMSELKAKEKIMILMRKTKPQVASHWGHFQEVFFSNRKKHEQPHKAEKTDFFKAKMISFWLDSLSTIVLVEPSQVLHSFTLPTETEKEKKKTNLTLKLPMTTNENKNLVFFSLDRFLFFRRCIFKCARFIVNTLRNWLLRRQW